MKRVMCIYLPSFPLQRLGRAEPGLRSRKVALFDPLAPRGPRIVLASRKALEVGVRPGMPVAEALSLEPGLVLREENPEADVRALLALARTAESYSPVVAIEEGPTPQSLLIDITGCAACFGGEERLLERARGDLARERWLARIALADTAGAAWAIAHHAADPGLIEPGAADAALRPLPLAALRLPGETLALLAQLGLRRVEDLLTLARCDLTTRFGPLPLRRLDQALGLVPEVTVPAVNDPELAAELALEFPTDRREVIVQALDQLAETLHQPLTRRNLGARLVECRLDHSAQQATTLEVGLYRPSACPRYLGLLLRTRLEQVRLVEPVRGVRLSIPRAEQRQEHQPAFFETATPDAAGLGELIDRLNGLLGRQAVTRPHCVPDPQPEHAFRFEAITARAPERKTRKKRRVAEPEMVCAGPPGPRPLTLWPEPVAVEVMAAYPDGPPARFLWAGVEWRVARWWGPERIETGWWRGRDVRRDYYMVTTHVGTRLWLYRDEDAGWFLQGSFD